MAYSIGQSNHNTEHFNYSFKGAKALDEPDGNWSYHLPERMLSTDEIGSTFRSNFSHTIGAFVVTRSFFSIRDDVLYSTDACQYLLLNSSEEFKLHNFIEDSNLNNNITDLRKIKNFIETHISELTIRHRTTELERKDPITIVNDLIYKHNRNIDNLEGDFWFSLWSYALWLFNTIFCFNPAYDYKESLKIEELELRNVLPAQG